MERTVEPELMDDDAQARAYAGADFAAPHERFVDLLLASWPPARGDVVGPILDLGCGPGDIVVRLARRLPRAVIHGVDGSAAMLKLGHVRVHDEGLAHRVTLVQALLPRDAPPLTAYPVVVSNSLLHHLHDPMVLWNAVKRFGAPGAHVFVMDLMRPGSAAEVDRLVEANTAGEPDVLRHDFRASLCAAFTPMEVRAQLHAAGLADLRADVVSDRHLTVVGTLPDRAG